MAFTYRGLQAEYKRHIITEEEVNRHMHRLLQQNPRVTTITDRPAQLGDEVILDYAGFCDGEQFAGGTAQKQTLVLGSGMFIPGFEEQLVDKVIGENVDVEVTFPKNYHAAELAGKKATFKCTIHEIRVKVPYELDDNFAKEVGGCETLDEMRKKLQESLQAYTDERGEMDLQDRLLQQASATLDFTPDPEALEKAADQQMKSLEAQLARQGLSLETYCKFMNTTIADLHKDAYPAAEATLRNLATVEEIVKLEGIEATQEDLGKAIALVCRENGVTAEQLKEYYTPEFETALMNSVLTTKVMQLIRDNAIISE